VLLAAFALRVWRLDVQNVWWDEGRNIDVAGRPMSAIAGAKELDIHPPGYFYLLHLWMGLAGKDAFTTRYLSIFFSILLLPLLYRLGRRLGDGKAALMAVALAALSPFLIGEAQETRMYTTAYVWLALAAYALLRAPADEHPLRWWTLYGLSSAASLLTHYSSAFVLVAFNLYVLLLISVASEKLPSLSHAGKSGADSSQHGEDGLAWLRGHRLIIAGGWLLSLLLTGLLFLPQAWRAYRQLSTYRNPTLHVPTPVEYARQCWQAYTVGLNFTGQWMRAGMIAFGVLLVLGLTAALWRRSGLKALAFLSIWLLVPWLTYYMVLLDRATFHPRYISFILPALYLLFGLALTVLGRLWRPLGLVAGMALLVFLAPAIHSDQFDERFFREDTSGLAAFLRQHAGPQDVVLVDVPYPLGYYYPRFRTTLPDPGDPELGEPDGPSELAPAYYLFVDVYSVADRLTALTRGRERVFWVQWYKSDTDPRGLVEFLLRKYGAWEGHYSVRGYTVDWYREPGDVTFELAPVVKPTSALFGEELRLVGKAFGGRGPGDISNTEEVRSRIVPADKAVWVVLDWRLAGKANAPYKASVTLRDGQGRVVGRDDRRLLNDRHLGPPYWNADETARSVFLVPLVPGSPPGRYTLDVAVYHPDTLEPLSVLDAAGAPQGTTVPIGEVEIVRALQPPPLSSLDLGPSPQLTRLGPISLLGGHLPEYDEIAPGMRLPVTLYWRAEADVRADYWVRLALMPVATGLKPTPGLELAYSLADSLPVNGTYPTSRWVAGEIVRDVHDWRIAPMTPPGEYRVMVGLVLAAGEEPLGMVPLGRIRVAGRPRHFTVPAMAHPTAVPVRLGNVAELLGYDLEPAMPHPGGTLTVTLHWRAAGQGQTDYNGFVHLLDSERQVQAQQDQQPGAGAFPTGGWLPGEIISDAYRIPLPTNLPSDVYTLEVGMYNPSNLVRLPVVAPPDMAGQDAVILGQVTIE